MMFPENRGTSLNATDMLGKTPRFPHLRRRISGTFPMLPISRTGSRLAVARTNGEMDGSSASFAICRPYRRLCLGEAIS